MIAANGLQQTDLAELQMLHDNEPALVVTLANALSHMGSVPFCWWRQ